VFGPRFRHELEEELARGCDVLHLEQLWSGWMGLRHTAKALVNLHYLFSIDLAHQPPTSLSERVLRAVTCRAERRLLRSYPTIVTLTDRLSDRVRELAPAADVHTVPLGLDIGLYPFPEDPGGNGRPVVGLIGSFNWPPTYSAGIRLITRLWPEIKRRVPEARLQIVGRQARQMLGQFGDVPDLSLHEDVADTAPYFTSTDVMLYAPAAGSGMKVKVLEAFALGTPVVTTGEGIEGIPAKDGVHAGVSEDDAGLIERTVRLLQDREARDRQRRAGRALLETHCSPGPTIDAMERVYATITP
jgi:glycosyltransferase involved in cell wall biosynthesis